MPTLKPLHERSFAGKPLKNFKVYNDPFGANEVCIELTFIDGHVEFVGIGPGRPEIVSTEQCCEHVRAEEHPDVLLHRHNGSEDTQDGDCTSSSLAL